MEEAERCHRLAIIDRGRLVAEGEPLVLMRDIGHTVVEVTAHNLRAAHGALASLPSVRSVAQLGNRLHLLLRSHGHAPHAAGAIGEIRGALDTAGVRATVEEAEAGLEDVFVAATGNGR
jgi:ABC-2 type transport system ATP-binding protein